MARVADITLDRNDNLATLRLRRTEHNGRTEALGALLREGMDTADAADVLRSLADALEEGD